MVIAGGPDDGCFWINLEDVFLHFSHMYVAWSPKALGLKCNTLHSAWAGAQGLRPTGGDFIGVHPQFVVRAPALAASTRLEKQAGPQPSADRGRLARSRHLVAVLSRHAAPGHLPQQGTDCGTSPANKSFVGISSFAGGARVLYRDGALVQGVFSNGEVAVCRVPLLEGDGNDGCVTEVVLVVSQAEPAEAFRFTLQVYAPGVAPPAVEVLSPLVPAGHVLGSQRGHWTARTAGGNTNDVWAYLQNPQWLVEVAADGPEEFWLFAETEDEASLNIRVFDGSVVRPSMVGEALSTGAYRRCCCALRVSRARFDSGVGHRPPHPTPWSAVAIVSTFQRGAEARFTVTWSGAPAGCAGAVQVRAQPHAFAGALPPPLRCAVRIVQQGRPWWLRVRVAGSGFSGVRSDVWTRVCMRLQRSGGHGGGNDVWDAGGAAPPILALWQVGQSALQPAVVDVLSPGESEAYHRFCGASVILAAELDPHCEYVVEAFLPTCCEVPSTSAKLYVLSEHQVHIGNAGPDGRVLQLGGPLRRKAD